MTRTTDDMRSQRDEQGRAAGPGRDAETPAEIPTRGWLQVLKRVKREAVQDNTSLLAGGVAFFALLAIVPLLVAALSIWGLFADAHDATKLIRDLASGLPHSARQLVSQQLRNIANRSSAGLGVTALISIVVALWSASSGTKHLIEAVNAAYDEEEDRNFVKVRAIALGFTFGAIVLGFVVIALIAVLPSALADAGVPHGVRVVTDAAVWPLLGVMMIVAFGIPAPVSSTTTRRSCV